MRKAGNLEVISGLNFDIHISRHWHSENDDAFATERQIRAHTEIYFRRPLFRKLLRTNEFRMVSQKIIVLKVHGSKGRDPERYWYNDGRADRLIQNWINKYDGKAVALVIMACNPNNLEITSKKSLVLHPSRNVRFTDLWRAGAIRMFVPGFGYVDRDYRLLYKAIRELC